MSKNSKQSFEKIPDEVRIDRAVRRAVGMKFALPSLRSMLRACGVYANVIAAVVALGLPTAGSLRSVAGSAALAFESAVRSARDSTSGLPDLLSSPTDLTEVTEAAGDDTDTETSTEEMSDEGYYARHPEMRTDNPVLEHSSEPESESEAGL